MSEIIRFSVEVLSFFGVVAVSIFAAGRWFGKVLTEITDLQGRIQRHSDAFDRHVADESIVFDRIEEKIRKIEILVNGRSL